MMPLKLAECGEECIIRKIGGNAVKIFERDEKVLEQLQLDETLLQHIEKDIADAEKELDDDSESIITNERYVYIASILKGCCRACRDSAFYAKKQKAGQICLQLWLCKLPDVG